MNLGVHCSECIHYQGIVRLCIAWLYSASGTLHVMMHGDTEDNPTPEFTQYGGSNIENSVTTIDGILNDGGDW